MYSGKEIDVLWLKTGAWLGCQYKHMSNSNDRSVFLFLVVLFCMFASISCLINNSGDLCLEQPFKVPKAEFKKIKNNIDFQSRNQCPELNGLSPSNL